jgi:hypothetical protein
VVARLVVLATALWCLPAAPANAGQYHVYLCQTPAGHGAPLGLTKLYDTSVDYISAYDNCTNGGSAGIGSGWLARTATSTTTQTITAPAFASLVHMDLTRQVRLRSEPDANAFPMWGVFRDYVDFSGSGRQLEACDPYTVACTALERANPLSVDLPAGTRTIVWMVGCGGTGTCVASSDSATDRAAGTVYAVHFVVSEGSNPQGSVTGQAALVAGTHAGTETAVVSATDAGAGVYQAFATLDGVAAGRVNAPGAGCSDKANNAASDLDFEAFQPCPTEVSGLALPVNTKVVADGARRLRIFVRDVAGNQTQIYDQVITVRNAGATPTPSTTPTPGATAKPGTTLTTNGGAASSATPAATAPTGAIEVLHRKRPRATASYGSKLSLALRVVDSAGQAIPNALVSIQERVRRTGAPWVDAGQYATRADGKLVIKPKTTASRELRFTYAYPGGSSTATFTVGVRARMTIKAARSVLPVHGTLRLSGRVAVDEFPKAGVYVDVQVRNGRSWQTIGSERTKGDGRWAWSFRMTRGVRAKFQFRARLRPYGDVAAAASSSRTVMVRVR